MATITLSDVTYYRSGATHPYEQIGNALSGGSPVPTVARYSFNAPHAGAQSVSLSITKWYISHGNPIALRFFVGTDASSHIDADSTYEYTGDLTVDSTNKIISGSADILLLPGRTYYLWIFPAEPSYGIYDCENAEAIVETHGSGGLVRIDNGTTLEGYSVYIEDGSEWAMYMPYLDTGSSWEPCG